MSHHAIIQPDAIRDADDSSYPGSRELHGIGANFGQHFGLQRLGIHHELLPPGRRTSRPHAEADEEEFVYVLSGAPDVWVDGELHRLQPGDAVGFPAGTGLAHTFINNTDEMVTLLVVGEKVPGCRVHYPLHPDYNQTIGERHWTPPARPQGPHDGLPDALRANPMD